MSIKLVISDIDGTLLSFDRDFNFIWNPLTIKSINKLKNKKIHFALATGRHYEDALNIINYLKIYALHPIFIIGMNGSQIFNVSEKKIYLDEYFSKDYKQEVVNFFNKFLNIENNQTIILLTCNQKIIQVFYNSFDNYLKNLQRFKFNKQINFDYQLVKKINWNLKIYKISILYKQKLSQKNLEINFLKSLSNRLEFVITGQHTIEILSKNFDKGTAVQFLKKYFKVNNNEILALGDADNDIPMFQETPNSCTRSCSSPSVLSFAAKNFNGGPSTFILEALKYYIN